MANLFDAIPKNKLCVDLKVAYKICIKGKPPLIIKFIKMIYLVMVWFEITQYNDNKVETIANLGINMWLVRYPCPTEITYEQGSKLFGHKFKYTLIEK